MGRGWQWTLLAAVAGFLAAFLFSSVLRFSRGAFLAWYTLVAIGVFSAYVRSSGLSLRVQFARRWVAGVIGGILIGLLLVQQVLGGPASPRAEGIALIGHLTWYGILYGIVDALLLSVLPVLAVYGSRPSSELQQPLARLRWAFVALLGSALVTAAYHAGFAEFRGQQLLQPLIGNTVITLAYLLTGSPWGAVISHVLMHAAAVVHGMATAMQLPPHY